MVQYFIFVQCLVYNVTTNTLCGNARISEYAAGLLRLLTHNLHAI